MWRRLRVPPAWHRSVVTVTKNTPASLRRGTINRAVTIDGLTVDCLGVGTIENESVVVHGALPDEVVDVAMQRGKAIKSEEGGVQRIGNAIHVHQASPMRVEPFCPHASTCNGCSLQHVHQEAQISIKQSILLDSLQQISQVTPENILDPIMGNDRGSRRKMRFSFRGSESVALPNATEPPKSIVFGPHSKFVKGLIDIDSCPALDHRAPVAALRTLLASLDMRPAIKQATFKSADNAVAILIEADASTPDAADLDRIRDFAAKTGAWLYFQSHKKTQPAELLFAGTETGSPHHQLHYNLNFDDSFSPSAIRLQFGIDNFVQMHADVNQQMVRSVVDALDLRTNDIVLDLFCGIGNLTLPIAAAKAVPPATSSSSGCGTASTGCCGGGCSSKQSSEASTVDSKPSCGTSFGTSSTSNASKSCSSGSCGSSSANAAVTSPDPCVVNQCTPEAQSACSAQKKAACASSSPSSAVGCSAAKSCSDSAPMSSGADPCVTNKCTPEAQSACSAEKKAACASSPPVQAFDPCVVNKCTPEAQAACSSEKKAACAQHIAPAPSSQASQRSLAVIGIDSSSSSIVRASENAEQNWLDDRASFYCADLHNESNLSLSTEGIGGNQLQDCWKRVRHLQSLHPDANVKVVIDPAFDGAINVLKSRLLNDFRVRRVVYVSCSGASLARDALLLCEGHGFKLHSLQMADMFPHTSHIESIAMFVR